MEKAKASQRAAGKMTGMTGKDMFDFGGVVYEDDEDEAGEDDWDISRMLARYVSCCFSLEMNFGLLGEKGKGEVLISICGLG